MTVDRTNAERQRRYIARLKERAAAAQGGVTNGKPEAELTRLKDENTRLKDELKIERNRAKMLEDGFQNLRRQQRAERPPKATKPPLPPDEARERRIKALTTESRNLKAKLRVMAEHYREGLATAGGMPFATQSAIAKILHPDERKHWTRAELDTRLDDACKKFTAWKADKDRAARKTKR